MSPEWETRVKWLVVGQNSSTTVPVPAFWNRAARFATSARLFAQVAGRPSPRRVFHFRRRGVQRVTRRRFRSLRRVSRHGVGARACGDGGDGRGGRALCTALRCDFRNARLGHRRLARRCAPRTSGRPPGLAARKTISIRTRVLRWKRPSMVLRPLLVGPLRDAAPRRVSAGDIAAIAPRRGCHASSSLGDVFAALLCAAACVAALPDGGAAARRAPFGARTRARGPTARAAVRFGGTRRKTSVRAWQECARRARGCATGGKTDVSTRRSRRTPLCFREASTLGSVTSTRAYLRSARFARTARFCGGRAPRADETRSRLETIPTPATTRRRWRGSAMRTGRARRARVSATSCARFGVRAPQSSRQPPSCSWTPRRPT